MKPVETNLIQLAMMTRGWSRLDVARRAGIKPCSLSTQLSQGVPNRLCRLKIEAAFSYEVPLWSSTAALAARKRCRADYGVDPCLLRRPELKELAARLHLPGAAAHRTKADLLHAVLLHLTMSQKSNKDLQ